jgi:RNA polymerase sigma-70 factor, ECF subfamily
VEAALSVDVDILYRQYGPMVLRRCRSMLRDEELAVEAMQDTFLQVVRRSDTMDAQYPSALLYQVATRVCLNQLRRTKRRPEDPADELLGRIAAAPEPDRLELRQLVERALGREQPSTRAMAVMHWVDGLSQAEVGEVYGITEHAVRKRLRLLRERVAAPEEVQ